MRALRAGSTAVELAQKAGNHAVGQHESGVLLVQCAIDKRNPFDYGSWGTCIPRELAFKAACKNIDRKVLCGSLSTHRGEMIIGRITSRLGDTI